MRDFFGRRRSGRSRTGRRSNTSGGIPGGTVETIIGAVVVVVLLIVLLRLVGLV